MIAIYRAMEDDTKHACAITIVIPIYNAAGTLMRALDSIHKQTFEDFEALMVDDGSTDDSSRIIDDYAKHDTRFKTFHKPNGGVSSARQFGIDHAEGEYSIHVDPDDWVEPNMLRDLYAKAKEDHADMVICDFYENTYRGQKYVKQEPSSLSHEVVLKEIFGKLHGSTCNKLIRTSCYKKYGVRFPLELSFCEDQYVVAALLKNDIKVAYLNQAFYHYVRALNQDSLSRRYTGKTLAEDELACELFYNLLKDTDMAEDIRNRKKIGVISKAFWWGKDYYSSKAFRKEFYSYKQVVLDSDKNKIEQWLLCLSCLGWYQPIIQVINMGLKIKHLLK